MKFQASEDDRKNRNVLGRLCRDEEMSYCRIALHVTLHVNYSVVKLKKKGTVCMETPASGSLIDHLHVSASSNKIRRYLTVNIYIRYNRQHMGHNLFNISSFIILV
jgi:hypothetical protein